MIWLATVSLAVGGLLAQRFKIVVLAPATLAVVVVTVAVGAGQTSGIWSSILIIAIVTVGVQIGYFLGMLIHYSLGALPARKSSRSSATRTAQNHSISGTPIS